MSPLEHQATPLANPTSWSGNLRGWQQLRKTIPGENMAFDYSKAVSKGWRSKALSILDKSA
jgi:hypothetical protein